MTKKDNDLSERIIESVTGFEEWVKENAKKAKEPKLTEYDKWAQSVLITTPGGIKPAKSFMQEWFGDTDYQPNENPNE